MADVKFLWGNSPTSGGSVAPTAPGQVVYETDMNRLYIDDSSDTRQWVNTLPVFDKQISITEAQLGNDVGSNSNMVDFALFLEKYIGEPVRATKLRFDWLNYSVGTAGCVFIPQNNIVMDTRWITLINQNELIVLDSIYVTGSAKIHFNRYYINSTWNHWS